MYAQVRSMTIITIVCAILLTGCNATTSEQTAGGGAAIGALIGGIAGGWEGAAIGALSGAALGWVAGKVVESQEVAARSKTQDQQLYGYAAPSDSVFVNINSAVSAPKSVTAGTTVDIVTDYSLSLPQDIPHTQVSVSGVLLKDGKELMDFKNQPASKTSGGYTIKLPLQIPAEAEAGTYVIRHTVSAGTTYDSAESTFVVTSA